ncbi:MAG: hypothetical protein ABJC05_02890 [Pyrinomonadaceae bacterium]
MILRWMYAILVHDMLGKIGERIRSRILVKGWQAGAIIACGLMLAPYGIGSEIVAQSSRATPSAPAAPLLRRTATRHETRRFGYGGLLTIVGPPAGSIAIEGWQRSEVEITADIEWRANTEEDLTRLSAIENFVLDEDANHLRILTSGTHDKAFMKRFAKGFPKKLIGLPWRIDFRIKVPISTDLEINAGNGPLKLSGVEGAIRVNALESDATITLTGGLVSVTLLRGSIKLDIPAHSWRGEGAEVRLATGELTIGLTTGFSGDIDADVLRLGTIQNDYPDLEPRERGSITPRSMRARAGAGGAMFRFTLGDGTLRIKQLKPGF